MSRLRRIILAAMCTAILIAAQLVLSGISGVEVVTVLLLCFCFSFGSSEGMIIATSFSLIRCLIFGFTPNVVILYLVYYNLFALFFGWLGGRLPRKTSLVRTATVVSFAAILTVMFTLLDDIITPIVMGFEMNAALAYAYASIYTAIPQTVCAIITVAVLFDPLTKIISKIK